MTAQTVVSAAPLQTWLAAGRRAGTAAIGTVDVERKSVTGNMTKKWQIG